MPTAPQPQVMIDLETLGKKPGSVIISLGAVMFLAGEIIDKFYICISAESCMDLGLKMDASTVAWWMQQSDAARSLFSPQQEKVDLPKALQLFSTWFGSESLPTWGNGATFDNVLLSAAYEACGLTTPWEFWHDRCYRTLKNTFPQVPLQARTGTHHNALDDAETQALHLIAIQKYQARLEQDVSLAVHLLDRIENMHNVGDAHADEESIFLSDEVETLRSRYGVSEKDDPAQPTLAFEPKANLG